jgi:hypothetical protein
MPEVIFGFLLHDRFSGKQLRQESIRNRSKPAADDGPSAFCARVATLVATAPNTGVNTITERGAQGSQGRRARVGRPRQFAFI